ncbi:MAG: rhomboid family intramembrane serine protease [Opitutus sp.]|nr:rhomboid family intramembrane serine protease [Opitutus sp.]
MFPLADTAKEKGPAVVTKLLIAVNVAVFAWQVSLSLRGGDRALAGFVSAHALVAQGIVRHPFDEQQWLTALTHLFLHGGVLHLLGNMWFLWIFGGNVEGRLGAWRYLIFYLLAGLAAAAAQVAAGPLSALPMVGASGAISGVLGAYLVLFPTAFVWAIVPWIVPVLPVPAIVFLVLWFVMQAYNGVGALLNGTGADGGVAWWAHAGGFAAGVAMILYAKRAKWVRRK